jgi:hypothetical protein
MHYSSREPLAAPLSRQLDLFDPERLRLTPAMASAAEEAADRQYLAYLREQQKVLPPLNRCRLQSTINPLPKGAPTQRKRGAAVTFTICRKQATSLGVFLADRPKRFGGRVHMVHLCGKCQRKGKRSWTQRVELELARRAAERTGPGAR